VLVVDTAGFLRNSPLENLGDQIVTCREVIAEILDRRTRERLSKILPYKIVYKEPSPASIKAVIDFARQTGDFQGLSKTDLKVRGGRFSLKNAIGVDVSVMVSPKANAHLWKSNAHVHFLLCVGCAVVLH
jgi:rRNA maturation endonuclease Nob1